ncbi:hypothetical protein QBC44DRAFT_392994 [Cladorrhinum sp. PSN332]|nr:hypothetical protein QBC44DRAFT_392994 [Cladorrhinum sp. PSN332]
MISLHLLLATALTHHVAARTLDTNHLKLSSPVIHARAEPVVLQPVRTTRRGNTKRDRRASLGLKSEESFYWQGTDGTVARFNLKAPGANENIVNLEEIDDLIQEITCPPSGSGELELQFAQAADFNDAEDIWDWVNREEDNHFLLVVGEGDCGFNTERILYNVTALSYNDGQETAVLQVNKTTWKTAAQNFDLTIGQDDLPSGSSRRRRHRRFLGDLVDTVTDAVSDGFDKAKDKFEETVDGVKNKTSDAIDKLKDKAKAIPAKAAELLPPLNKDFTIPFQADGLTGKTLTITNNGLDTAVTCVECSTSGSISIKARFSADAGKISEASIDLSLAEDLKTTAILTMALKGDITSGLAVSKSVPIFEFSPAGIVIPGIVTIGPTVAINLGAEINEVKGAISMTLGGKATLPKGSSARLDFLDENKLSKNGWELGFEPEPFKADASITASAGVFLRGSVGIEVSALERGFSAQLSADLPNLAASVKAIASPTCTACGSFPVGLEGSIGFAASVGVSLTKKLGGVDQTLKGLRLSQAAPPIASVCRGFEVQAARDRCPARP